MSVETTIPQKRTVGFLLGIGILLLPIIFVWFLLRSGYSVLARVVGFGWFGVVMLIWIGGAMGSPSSTTPTAAVTSPQTSKAVVTANPKTDTPAGKAKPTTKWVYREQKDEMRGTTAKYASLVSDNELDFEFPYGRGNSTTLNVRKDGGMDAFLTIENGQFLCNGFTNDSYLSVKFDDGPIQKFSCTSASDGSADTAFITNAARFVTGLKASKRTVIEPEFFQSGRRQIIFTTSGLEWE